ncbi:nitrite reductase (NAD(P)H) small subunit [Bacillus sp. B15-48]|uniref:nitrite reductase (NAD(P)H) small subunit n=1 Tax=Bacillus sp. B15-48 TaxID=1548601 RepID=UPI00193FF544|nr:nitrite reductase (NAD(P)H) small subunit [Bacillus sp. B15-48]MBM4765062.1 Rieske 2Fe-2S domain-containing protein [Bacillus sp. B15-48]
MDKILIADYHTLPVGVGQVYKINGEEVVLFRLSNGDVRAIENRSPHPKGGTLSEGLVSGEYLYCPVYDWKISLKDGQVQAPDEGYVKIYQLEQDKDHVFIVK